MSYARIPDFSQPAPVQRAAVDNASPRRAPVDGRYLNLPNEPLPGEGDLWHVVAPVHIIAILDAWDGDADLEPDADAEPSLAAPENAHGSQVAWLRGGDEDREVEVPETVLPKVIRGPAPRIRSVPAPASAPLPWGGNGNVVSAAAVALFALMAGEA